MLTKSNYQEWSLLMKVKLQAQQLWEAVRVSGVSHNDDRRALEALCAAVPFDVAATIADKATAKMAWDASRCGGSAASACVAPRYNSSEESGKVSPFSPASK
jgi:hypothetical protein